MSNEEDDKGAIEDLNPPSQWGDLLRQTEEIASWQVRYHRGGKGKGYRDLGKRTKFSPQDVVDEDGDEELDGIDEIASEAWEIAREHWERTLEQGKKFCQYRLFVFGEDKQELARTDPIVCRANSGYTDDFGLSPTDSWQRHCESQGKLIDRLIKHLERQMRSTIELQEHVGDMLRRLPQAPPNNDAAFHADAVVRAQRSREAGETLRTLIETFAPMVQEHMRRSGVSVPVDVIAELYTLGADPPLIAAVLAGDRRTARTYQAPEGAEKYHAWLDAD